jgi:hypothetical protein
VGEVGGVGMRCAECYKSIQYHTNGAWWCGHYTSNNYYAEYDGFDVRVFTKPEDGEFIGKFDAMPIDRLERLLVLV